MFYEKTEDLIERNELVVSRIAEMKDEKVLPLNIMSYVKEVSEFVLFVQDVYEKNVDGTLFSMGIDEAKEINGRCYNRLLEENYKKSFLNPEYATEIIGEELGGMLSAVYADMLALFPYAYEDRIDLITIFEELFSEIYGLLVAETEEFPINDPDTDKFEKESLEYLKKSIKDAIYWFYHDYAEVFRAESVQMMVSTEYNFFKDIVENTELNDLSYLYRYGAPIGDNELKMAAFLNSLPEEDIEAMASTYTEGYRIGFEVTERDITKKKSVKVEYPIGFERVVRVAFKNFREMGLEPIVARDSILSCQGRTSGRKRNTYSTDPNPQFLYDHKEDKGFYYDKGYAERVIEVTKDTFEKNKTLAKTYGGPAVIEVFGEPDFEPLNKSANYHFTDEQNELDVYLSRELGKITNTYIPGDEYSFTIISYPLPSIGDNFEEIFNKTVEVNTLDYTLYRDMQQKIIDVLDKGEYARVLGKGDNKTDLKVSIHSIKDATKETIFENCVADVNIPVGEVFTSPVLKGTEGILHVSKVYLNGLSYSNLEINFKDGMIADYICDNFPTEEENKKYIFDNILFHHDTLPIGEFAIGTNTTAYKMGIEYGIQSKLPILIAEKTGPHFAVGDTCYSHAEDVVVHNPDGKEIIARSNECADLRDTDPDKAYFNCHTDITIPYDELDKIYVVAKDGTEYMVIDDGKFVVPGTEKLNEPLNK